jgi:ABC-type nitrate/sulfonate/bicarbonate transport systems, periplasmic components
MKKTKKILALCLIAALVCVCFSGCGSTAAPASAKSSGTEGTADYSGLTLRLAAQYGMQYAPVYVLKEMGYLEQLLPGVKLEWDQLAGGSAMNEALISGSLDVAFMGIPPALIAIDSGAAYRVACGICVPPAELMVPANSGIKSLADLNAEGVTIAVPSIGSIQDIMLSTACESQLGDANALSDNLVAMGNADAYAAFKTGSVTAHFASMPYIADEQNDGMVSILNADDCGGGASIVCVCTEDIHQNEAVYNALLKGLQMAVDLINTQSDQVLQIIASNENCTADEARTYLNWPGTLYTEDVCGLTRLGEFMAQHSYLKNDFQGFGSYTWEGAMEGK